MNKSNGLHGRCKQCDGCIQHFSISDPKERKRRKIACSGQSFARPKEVELLSASSSSGRLSLDSKSFLSNSLLNKKRVLDQLDYNESWYDIDAFELFYQAFLSS